MNAINRKEREYGFWKFITLAGVLSWIIVYGGYSTADFANTKNNTNEEDAKKIPFIHQQIDSLNTVVLILNSTLEHALKRSSLDEGNISDRVKENNIISENTGKINDLILVISKISKDSLSTDNISLLNNNLLQLQSKLSDVELKCKPCLPSGDCSSIQNQLIEVNTKLATANTKLLSKNFDLKAIKTTANELNNNELKNGAFRNNKEAISKVNKKIAELLSSIDNAIKTNNN